MTSEVDEDRNHIGVLATHVRAVWSACKSLQEYESKGLVREMHEAAMSMIVHGGIIAKFFISAPVPRRIQNRLNGIQKKVEERRERLCKKFNIGEHSIFRRGQDLRNFIEHIDEKIDIYLVENTDIKIFADLTIGDNPLVVNQERIGILKQEQFMFRHYDPSKKIYHCLGSKYDLRELVTACNGLADEIGKNRLGQALMGDIFDHIEDGNGMTAASMVLGNLAHSIYNRIDDLRRYGRDDYTKEAVDKLSDFWKQAQNIKNIPDNPGVEQAALFLKSLDDFCHKHSNLEPVRRLIEEQDLSYAIQLFWQWQHRVPRVKVSSWV